MSDTPVDMAKVTQMLDAGWRVSTWKNDINSYSAHAEHDRYPMWARARQIYLDEARRDWIEGGGCTFCEADDILDILKEIDWDEEGVVIMDDFTPEQALARLAYKVHGECI